MWSRWLKVFGLETERMFLASNPLGWGPGPREAVLASTPDWASPAAQGCGTQQGPLGVGGRGDAAQRTCRCSQLRARRGWQGNGPDRSRSGDEMLLTSERRHRRESRKCPHPARMAGVPWGALEKDAPPHRGWFQLGRQVQVTLSNQRRKIKRTVALPAKWVDQSCL